jgi:hypothetical protein
VRRGSKGIIGLLACWGSASCAGSFQQGPPLEDPVAVADRARESTGTEHPSRVRFEWEYADERGNLRGDGVGRVNPPDSFRLDLFTSAEGSMAAVLVDDRLDTLGEMEDVELPAPPFLYAMAGVFRPGDEPPSAGFRSGDSEVIGYTLADGSNRYYFLRDSRLVRVEERQGNRLVRRIDLEWGTDSRWPREARYRDDLRPNRVRWELIEVRTEDTHWPVETYDLGPPS